jgi:hypothetical protein
MAEISDLGDVFHALIEWSVMSSLTTSRKIAKIMWKEVAELTGFRINKNETNDDYQQLLRVVNTF